MKFLKIVIPTYNSQNTIRRCIESILCQTCGDFQIIIVDDKSTDDTINVCEGFNDDRITIIKNDIHGYAGICRNIGINYKTDCEYTWFIDSDDWLLNEKSIEILKRSSTKNPDVILFKSITFINGKYINWIPQGDGSFISRDVFTKSMYRVPWNKIVKSNKCGFFPEHTMYLEDNFNLMTILNSIDDSNIVDIDDRIYVYNVNHDSTTRKQCWNEMKMRMMPITLSQFENYIPNIKKEWLKESVGRQIDYIKNEMKQCGVL